jgi:catechol 2,3-dioxygenase-like lactoylglutathione lyase family enzyme
MIDHVSLTVADYERSKRFYEAALAPLGYALLNEIPASVPGGPVAGFGDRASKKPDLWIAVGDPQVKQHVAITAATRAQVRDFHAAALAAGGADNGPPGLRPQYHPHYYGAFARDPDGHNIEAVRHGPGP